MIDAIDTKNIPSQITTDLNRNVDIQSKKTAVKPGTVQNKVLLTFLDKVPKNIQSQTAQKLSQALPQPKESVNKSDINNVIDKIDPNISMGVFFELLQKFMLWMRKSTRTEFLEERSLYNQEMNKAADDIRSAAGFTMAAGIVGGAIGIVASVVGIGGAIKAAKIDQAGMQEVGEMEKGFQAKNLDAEAQTSTPGSKNLTAESKTKITNPQDQTLAKSTEAQYNVKDEKVTLSTKSTDVKSSKPQLTDEQQSQITNIRNIASQKSARVIQRSDIAKSMMTSSAQVISGSLEYGSGAQKAAQTQEEAEASTTGSYAEQQTQLYSQAGESMGKLQQKLSSIIESDIEARRTIIRS